MVRLVICNSEYAGESARSIEKARKATKRGFKKCWDARYSYDGLYWGSRHISQIHNNKYSIFAWTGSEDQFLLFKLSESTGLVKAYIDIEDDDKLWTDLEWEAIRRCIYNDDLAKGLIDEATRLKLTRDSFDEMGKFVYKALEPIKDKL